MRGAEDAGDEDQRQFDHAPASSVTGLRSRRASASELVTTNKLLKPIAKAAMTGCNQPAAAKPMPIMLYPKAQTKFQRMVRCVWRARSISHGKRDKSLAKRQICAVLREISAP